MRILFLTPWYPSPADRMAGLFVEKMVVAARADGAECEVISEMGTVAMFRHLVRYLRRSGRPDLVHLHVATKQGLIALLLRRAGVPYLLTEHYTGFLPANGDFERRSARPVVGPIYRAFVRRVVRCAAIATAVSGMLRRSMQAYGLTNPDFRILYNVVDAPFLVPREPREGGRTEFLHVSCYNDRAKNTTGIIRAAAALAAWRRDFHLTMAGTGPDFGRTEQLARELGLTASGLVEFTGELTPRQVAARMRSSDCFVLFSRFETAAVVLQEAMTVGLPCISTPTGIATDFPAYIRITPEEDTDALAAAMSRFIDCPMHVEPTHVFISTAPLINIYRTLADRAR